MSPCLIIPEPSAEIIVIINWTAYTEVSIKSTFLPPI